MDPTSKQDSLEYDGELPDAPDLHRALRRTLKNLWPGRDDPEASTVRSIVCVVGYLRPTGHVELATEYLNALEAYAHAVTARQYGSDSLRLAATATDEVARTFEKVQRVSDKIAAAIPEAASRRS